MSLKVQPGPPIPIRQYREKDLETRIACDDCTLEYAVFGVFAYCPDCGAHNSLLILRKNLELARKQLALADSLIDVDLQRHLTEDALENCVSAFDGFAREACRIRADKSADPAKCDQLSFQNLIRAADKVKALFGADLAVAVKPAAWSAAHVAFMQRHLLAHKSGVIDQRYLHETGESRSLLGRRVTVKAADVHAVADTVLRLGQHMIDVLPTPK